MSKCVLLKKYCPHLIIYSYYHLLIEDLQKSFKNYEVVEHE